MDASVVQLLEQSRKNAVVPRFVSEGDKETEKRGLMAKMTKRMLAAHGSFNTCVLLVIFLSVYLSSSS